MNTCNLIYTLLHQIPKNEMSLSDETVTNLYNKCKSLVNSDTAYTNTSLNDSYLNSFPKKEMFMRLLGCGEEYALLMSSKVHIELEKAELTNDIDKLLELKKDYPDFCQFYMKRYPWYQWDNFKKLNDTNISNKYK